VKSYLSVCAIFRDEAPYLAEWVEFHRLVGAEHFYLYDNRSTDESRDVLAPYVEHGLATVRDWSPHPGQGPAYDDCLQRHGGDSRWIAFIDLDEFLFSPTGRPLTELLVDYERWPALGVNRVNFGTSGHRQPPPGLVIESYVWKFRQLTSIKSIVDPSRTERHRNPHAFYYADGAQAVDENEEPIEKWFPSTVTFEKFQINHYLTKSEEEYALKLTRERADSGELRDWDTDATKLTGKVKDEAITVYVPALHEALSRRFPRGAPSG
jgi:Glycosyltransferase family 92